MLKLVHGKACHPRRPGSVRLKPESRAQYPLEISVDGFPSLPIRVTVAGDAAIQVPRGEFVLASRNEAGEWLMPTRRPSPVIPRVGELFEAEYRRVTGIQRMAATHRVIAMQIVTGAALPAPESEVRS